MLDRIEFLTSEAFAAFRRNGLMTLAAISTAAVALFVIGGLGLAYLKVRDFSETLQSRFTMRAFMKDGASMDEIKAAAASIRQIKGVAEVNWIPRDRAWKLESAKNPELTAGIENPFPDAFKIRLADLSRTEDIVTAIEGLPGISRREKVQYMAAEQQMLAQAKRFIRWFGVAVGGLCLLTAAVLIYNAIRLTVIARRRELRVMQLVGASFTTIRVPFLIEGALQGLFGGVLATVLMFSAQLVLARELAGYASLGQPGSFPFWPMLTTLGLAGIGFGAICSAAAVRDPLKLGATSQ